MPQQPFATGEVIKIAQAHLETLPGHIFDVISVSKPVSPNAAVDLAKVISKLSPLVGNMIEFNTCEFLNAKPEFQGVGRWRRQDPGFPDVVFDGGIVPVPGFEMKAWFPLATEITARFKDSQNHFTDDRTYVAMMAWLPEFVIYGKPRIIGVVTASGQSVAKARDDHYHNPPDYLVVEPGDTSSRASNLQQTNTNGYKWQPDANPEIDVANRSAAEEIVRGWGVDGKSYSTAREYQHLVHQLMGRFRYRLDTNYAKMDRIGHAGIQAFAQTIYNMPFNGRTIGEWNQLLCSRRESRIRNVLSEVLGITENSDSPVK